LRESTPGNVPVARRSLEELFSACKLARPFRRAAYDPGDRLEYEVTGVVPARSGRVVAEVERSVGGGFAGQVYRVRLLEITADEGAIEGLEVGQHYAIKILTPQSGFARWFRNLLYFVLIRRAAAVELGDGEAVCDTYATFFDGELHSFGEINEWIEGRIWAFEADDRLLSRWRFSGAPPPDHNCPEYVHKKLFMRRLVALLHEIGAAELARQYEWGTCKSQPNALKRIAAEDTPSAGLTAVDFRAGLALIFFLPMSPADVFLILRGLVRGRLVQFDRCDTHRLRRFVDAKGGFDDLEPAIEELERQDAAYRASQPDLTRHLFRLFTDRQLRGSIKSATITVWRNLGRLDGEHDARLRAGRAWFTPLYLLGMVPFLGPWVVGLRGNATKRHHLKRCLVNRGYVARAMRGSRIEALVAWTRAGRVLPASWHRFAAEPSWARERIRDSVRYALSFLRQPEFREQALLEQVRLGHAEGMLTDAEAAKIEGQIKDPFIQKYLRCLAVHVCTVPVTQVVMVLAGAGVAVYCLVYRDLSWPESMGYAAAAAAAIQLLPISPGSITRGVFVLFLMVRERDLRNYWVAAPVSFLHVIGYLAFPLQMVTHNPALARFLAGRWTRRFANVVPVFGEHGALLEHGVFDLFFNLPISIARGLRQRPVRWAGGILATAAVLAAFVLAGFTWLWEWRQPRSELAGVTVTSAVSYYERGGDIGWSRNGARVRFEGVDGTVDFLARHWDRTVRVGDSVDAVIRRSFFGGEYDGLAITRHPSPESPLESAPPRAEDLAVTIFAPAVVSTEAPEFATSFSADGRRVFFNRASPDRSRIALVTATRVGETWQEQGELAFAGEYRDVDPFVTADGSRLYFSSDRPLVAGEPKDDFDIWFAEWQGDDWGDPVPLGAPVNTAATEVFTSLSKAGNLYFGSNRDGVFDIYRAVARADGYLQPERLGLAIDEETSAGNPWIAADESFLIFSSGRPGGLGASDLWVSFQMEGGWSEPRNLGSPVNSPQADFAPALGPGESYL
jgi:hypothetical protein